MIVVSDSTPLITLMKAARLDVLNELFGDVYIPETVYKELTLNEAFSDEADLIRASEFIKVVKVEKDESVTLLQRATGLDRGESEAIVYADDNHADLLLMDEAAGREVIGTSRKGDFEYVAVDDCYRSEMTKVWDCRDMKPVAESGAKQSEGPTARKQESRPVVVETTSTTNAPVRRTIRFIPKNQPRR